MDKTDFGHVYIVADKKFPHGDAGGNRILYMCECLKHEEINPIVVSVGDNLDKDYDKEHSCYIYLNIKYKNVHLRDGKMGVIQKYFFSGLQAGRMLKKLGLKNNSIVIVYTTNPLFALGVNNSIPSELNCKIVYDVVEWDDYTSFRFGKLDPRYWIFNWCFYKIYPKADGIIAISKNIQKHFERLGCPVHRFPICLDANEFKKNAQVDRCFGKKIKFIYPGNPGNKDDIKTVLEALSFLSPNERERVEFHFTAVKEKTIRDLMGNNQYLLEQLKTNIIFHQWMEYDELMKLYHTVDALFMLRKNNQITKSNFPSKVPELMSCGIIIIANDQGDFFEYLTEDVNAIKINNNSVEACVVAIRKLIYMSIEKRKFMSLEAIKCAENKFDYRNFSRPLVDFLIKETRNAKKIKKSG